MLLTANAAVLALMLVLHAQLRLPPSCYVALRGATSLIPGGRAGIAARVSRADDSPLPGVEVTGYIHRAWSVVGVTNGWGEVELNIPVPHSLTGRQADLHLVARAPGGATHLVTALPLDLAPRWWCLADRERCQPGEEFGLWIGGVEPGTARPAAGRRADVSLHDLRGRRGWQGRAVTDRFGLARLTVPLAAEIPPGAYTIHIDGRSIGAVVVGPDQPVAPVAAPAPPDPFGVIAEPPVVRGGEKLRLTARGVAPGATVRFAARRGDQVLWFDTAPAGGGEARVEWDLKPFLTGDLTLTARAFRGTEPIAWATDRVVVLPPPLALDAAVVVPATPPATGINVGVHVERPDPGNHELALLTRREREPLDRARERLTRLADALAAGRVVVPPADLIRQALAAGLTGAALDEFARLVARRLEAVEVGPSRPLSSRESPQPTPVRRALDVVVLIYLPLLLLQAVVLPRLLRRCGVSLPPGPPTLAGWLAVVLTVIVGAQPVFEAAVRRRATLTPDDLLAPRPVAPPPADTEAQTLTRAAGTIPWPVDPADGPTAGGLIALDALGAWQARRVELPLAPALRLTLTAPDRLTVGQTLQAPVELLNAGSRPLAVTLAVTVDSRTLDLTSPLEWSASLAPGGTVRRTIQATAVAAGPASLTVTARSGAARFERTVEPLVAWTRPPTAQGQSGRLLQPVELAPTEAGVAVLDVRLYPDPVSQLREGLRCLVADRRPTALPARVWLRSLLLTDAVGAGEARVWPRAEVRQQWLDLQRLNTRLDNPPDQGLTTRELALLTLALSQSEVAVGPEPGLTDALRAALLARQRPDGSWPPEAGEEPSPWAAWALAIGRDRPETPLARAVEQLSRRLDTLDPQSLAVTAQALLAAVPGAPPTRRALVRLAELARSASDGVLWWGGEQPDRLATGLATAALATAQMAPETVARAVDWLLADRGPAQFVHGAEPLEVVAGLLAFRAAAPPSAAGGRLNVQLAGEEPITLEAEPTEDGQPLRFRLRLAPGATARLIAGVGQPLYDAAIWRYDSVSATRLDPLTGHPLDDEPPAG